MNETADRLSGIVPPLVTPLKARDQLDHSGLEKLIEHVIAGGVNGVFLLGTTGEAPSHSYRLRRELIAEAVRFVNGRVPVLVGIADTSFTESVRLAHYAAEQGVDAAVLTTPYYFPVGQTELTGYVEQLLPEIPLPVMLYNMPSMTKVSFETETLRRLADIEKVIGVKDSSGDLSYFADVCSLKQIRPDWSVFIGPEALLPEAVRLGGDGCVAGGANVIPGVFTECFDAVRTGDETKLRRMSDLIREFQAIYDIGKYASRHVKATKSALSLLGVCNDLPADPFHAFLPRERARVREILQKIGCLS